MTTNAARVANPVHTFIVLIDAEGNVSYKDIQNDVEGFLQADDEILFQTGNSRAVLIGHLDDEPGWE